MLSVVKTTASAKCILIKIRHDTARDTIKLDISKIRITFTPVESLGLGERGLDLLPVMYRKMMKVMQRRKRPPKQADMILIIIQSVPVCSSPCLET